MPEWKPGDFIAKQYKLARLLGRGGMGEIWLATRGTEPSQSVALKIASDSHPAIARLLEREYNALKGLVHPHLPCVYDFGYTDDSAQLPYLAMEYLRGEELSAKALPNLQEDVCEILVQLSRALAFLHTHGIIHGDLKPQNIVVTSCQPLHVKLIDFGLASTESEGEPATLGGTVPYIAPELLLGGRPSAASDLYALGVIVFSLVASRFPFEAADEALTLRKRVEEEAPSLLKYVPRTSVGLSDIVALLLRRDSRARPKSAREVIALLNEKEGRAYPYETAQSRAAYLKSSAYHPYRSLREKLLKMLQETEAHAENAILVCGEPLMGLGIFLSELAEQLEKSGCPARQSGHEEWGNLDSLEGAVWILGPLKAMPGDLPVMARTRNARAIVVGIERDRKEDHPEAIPLPHLDIPQLEDMVGAVFGQHRFPADFSQRLWHVTFGHFDAVHEVFTELLNREWIDVGIEGWQWHGVDTDWPVSSSLLNLWQARFETLEPVHQKVLALLALTSNGSLPLPVWKTLASFPESEEASIMETLARRQWISLREHAALRGPIQALAIRASLPTAQVRQVHGLLATVGPLSSQDLAEVVAHIGHLILSPSPQIEPFEALTRLRNCIKQGQAWAVRRLAQEAMASMAERSPDWQTVLWLLYAESMVLAGSLVEARDVAFRAVEMAQKASLCDELAEARLVLSSILERLGEWDEAEKQLAACHEETPSLAADRKMVLFSSWAWIRFRKGDMEQADTLTRQALSIGSGTPESLGRLHQTLGNLAYFRGDLDAAIREWEIALKHYDDGSDARGKSDIYNNLGAAAARRGNRPLAREHWERCKQLSEQTASRARVAGLLNNLAICAFEEGDLRAAEGSYEEALRIYRRLDAPRERIEVLNNLGELNFYRANYLRARAFWNEALSEAETLGDTETKIEPLIYLGKLFFAIGYPEESRRCLEQALVAARECDSALGRAHALCELAVYQMFHAKFEEAGRLLDESESLLRGEEDSSLRWNVLTARLQLFIIAQQQEQAASLSESLAAHQESDATFVSRAHLGLLTMRQEKSSHDETWMTRIADFPEFAWRASWHQAQKAHAQQNPALMRQEIEKAASRLRMIAEQLADEEQEKYLQSYDVKSFQQWARTVM